MPARLKIRKLVVIGVGLIGGSFALALKRARAVEHIVGVGRTRGNLNAALKLKIIDEALLNPAHAVRDADFVLLATPVGQMPAVMTSIAPHMAINTVITDAGSTKRDVIASARRFLGEHFSHFVPGHPIAGTEKNGATSAFPDLFQGKNVILTPLPETSSSKIQIVRQSWETCGARVIRMGIEEHDKVLAAVSHLPHVVAYALVNMLARRRNPAQLFGLSAGGLRDTVRIAGSSPEMWADICVANRDALLAALEDYENELEQMRAAIDSADVTELRRMFAQARGAREKWLAGKRP